MCPAESQKCQQAAKRPAQWEGQETAEPALEAAAAREKAPQKQQVAGPVQAESGWGWDRVWVAADAESATNK